MIESLAGMSQLADQAAHAHEAPAVMPIGLCENMVALLHEADLRRRGKYPPREGDGDASPLIRGISLRKCKKQQRQRQVPPVGLEPTTR
jgi:hypothetical protein